MLDMINSPQKGDHVKIVLTHGIVEEGIVINCNENWIELGSILRTSNNTLQVRAEYIIAVQIFKNSEPKSIDMAGAPKIVKEREIDPSSVFPAITKKITGLYENNRRDTRGEISRHMRRIDLGGVKEVNYEVPSFKKRS